MPKVIMWSDVYGLEEFTYETEREAREGFERLKATCRHEEFDFETEQEAKEGFERLKATCRTNDDGIERHLYLVIESWSSSDDEVA